MPIYEYACADCGLTFEVLRPIDAPPLALCGPFCVADSRPGDGAVRKLLSAPAVHTGSAGLAAEAPTCGRCGRLGGGCA